MAGRDRISELPAHVLDHILGFLPVVEAARTSVLSTVWRDIWRGLTCLNFDFNFFRYIESKYSSEDILFGGHSGLYVIGEVLMQQHNGPIRKFVFMLCGYDMNMSMHGSSEFDQFDEWLLLLSRNGVEEIQLAIEPHVCIYSMPDCIFSCLTLKRLQIYGLCFELINARCIFPNVTSICFENVLFSAKEPLDWVPEVPMLENLTFDGCADICHFNIRAPKLSSLTIRSCLPTVFGGFLPVNLDLVPLHTLDLYNSCTQDFFKDLTRKRLRQQPVLANLECLKLQSLHFLDVDQIPGFLHLLQTNPKLRKLDMILPYNGETPNYIDAALKHSEELHSMAQTHKTLQELRLSSFIGSRSEMLFIKGLLACFPVLVKVVISRGRKFDANEETKIMQELMQFPRASTKAEIICL